ncbi:MAG: hypothetical protein AAF961_10485, partial [Planctomycetota bacterium]
PELAGQTVQQAPAVLGKSTEEAIASGVYWGIAGGVQRIVNQLAADCIQSPVLVATGGAAACFVQDICLQGRSAKLIPHLTLTGIAASAVEASR